MKRPTFRFLAGFTLGLGSIAGASYLAIEHFTVDRDASKARQALASGQSTLARAPLERWLRARPRSPDAHVSMAEFALADGDLGMVSSELNQARSLGCSREKLDRVHALALARMGRYGEAEPILVVHYQGGAGGDPAVDEALARVYLMTYRLNEAEKVIQQWVRDAPLDGRPFLWLTEFDRRMEVDNIETQERHYRDALRRDPLLHPARLGLAETLRKEHRNAEAAKEFDDYLKHDPEDVAALTGAGQVARELNDLTASAGLLDKALKLAPQNLDALRGMAALELMRGDVRAAGARLDSVLRIDPYDTEGFYKRAQVRRILGDAEGAKNDLEAFKRLTAENAEVLKLRAILMVDGNNNEARSKVAAWMLAHGREQDGLGWARAVLTSDPDHVATNSLLADYYGRNGADPGLANFYRLRASTGQSVAP